MTMRCWRKCGWVNLLFVAIVAVVCSPLRGQSDNWRDRVVGLIDEHIRTGAQDASMTLASDATDSELLRRMHLDLTGRPAEPHIVVSYLSSKDPNKRLEQLDRIGASVAMSVRMADYWSEILLPENSEVAQAPARQSLQRWLFRQFSDGKRYDRIVADLLVAKGDLQDSPTAFFSLLESKPEKLAEKTARVFLGVSLDCAQCHDHPFDRWKQRDFWGVAAYFAQVRMNGNVMVPMSSNVFDVASGEVYLPEKTEIVPPKPLIEGVESSIGIGSRRQQLAIWITSRQNDWFARATVNRVWAMLMGRGLIEPVDDMSAASNSPHSELLNNLAVLFRESGFDLKRLMLAIASSDAYARSSQGWDQKSQAHRFLGMISKPLTADQLAASLRQVARSATPAQGQDAWTALAGYLGKTRGEGSEFVGGILQSLTMQNAPSMEQLWMAQSSKLLAALDAPYLDRQQKINWQFLATLGREPNAQERELAAPFCQESTTDSEFQEFRVDLLWAQINSTEFAMTP